MEAGLDMLGPRDVQEKEKSGEKDWEGSPHDDEEPNGRFGMDVVDSLPVGFPSDIGLVDFLSVFGLYLVILVRRPIPEGKPFEGESTVITLGGPVYRVGSCQQPTS